MSKAAREVVPTDDTSMSSFNSVAALQLTRGGTMHVAHWDGGIASASTDRDAFAPSSLITSATFVPASFRLVLQTTRDDQIVLEIPRPHELSPLRGRPTIYLDQNHWSTLTNTIHEPTRVRNAEERTAAQAIIDLAQREDVVLPISSAHLAETCQQANADDRYRRALTIAQLSRGWQLRDPLALRRFELRQALTVRFHQRCLLPQSPVTLEPNALHAERGVAMDDIDATLPEDVRWVVHALRCIGGIVDTLLDAEHLPMPPASGWASEMQRFAGFLAENPTGREMLRRRTHAKFIADLGIELPEEARQADITPEQVVDWAVRHSEEDLPGMPALGLFREVMHEKLCDPALRWNGSDLLDMMYLTAGAAYCDHTVSERSHGSHITNGWRRQGVERTVHTSLRSLVEVL